MNKQITLILIVSILSILLLNPVKAVEWISKVNGFNIYLYENQNLTFALPWLYDIGGSYIGFNETRLLELVAAGSTDYRYVQNKSTGDCPSGNYTYGFYQNGTLKCRDDLNTGTGSGVGGGHIGQFPLYNDSTYMYFNYSINNLTNYLNISQIDNASIIRASNTSWCNTSGLIKNWSLEIGTGGGINTTNNYLFSEDCTTSICFYNLSKLDEESELRII